jgi:hypothetical protein
MAVVMIARNQNHKGLAALATSQPDCLTIFLELRDELVTLLHNVNVLLVLVVWTIRLYDLIDPVNGARDAIHSDEVAEIPIFNISHGVS